MPWQVWRLEPREIFAMEEGEQWRHSRMLDLMLVAASLIADRIPFNRGPVDLDKFRKGLSGYQGLENG